MTDKKLVFNPVNVFAEDSSKGMLINFNNKWTAFPKNSNYLVTTWNEKELAVKYLESVPEPGNDY